MFISLPDIFCIRAIADISLSAFSGSSLPIATRISLALSLLSRRLRELINSFTFPGSCSDVVVLIKASNSPSLPANNPSKLVAVATGICPPATIVFILTSSSLLSKSAEDSKNASAKSPCPVASACVLTLLLSESKNESSTPAYFCATLKESI